MDKSVLAFLFFVSFCFTSKAQNLVPNPSFENITQCPSYNEIYFAPPWFQPCIHFGNTYNSSSTDLYDTCSNSAEFGIPTNVVGFQYARTGIGYAGIAVYEDTINYREYLEVPLLDTLIANKKYCVEFYVSLSNPNVAVSNFGAYFSADSLLDTTNLKTIDYVTPQIENPNANMLNDTLNWMLVSGNFIATGGERFLTIGNFHLPANTNIQNLGSGTIAYYYIDDVSVLYCDPSGVDEMKRDEEISISPNPFSFQTTISFTEPHKNNIIKITDILGKEIKTINFTGKQCVIERGEMNAGVYFVQIIDENKNVVNRKIVLQ